jgi:predicted MFS family arabinose efflux permease
MAGIALALVRMGNSTVLTTLLLGLWGLVATAAPVGWWTWLSKTLPDHAEAGGGLMVAIIQLAIASGAILGGQVFDMSGYEATFELSAAVLVVAAALACLAARASGYRGLSMLGTPRAPRCSR